MSSRIDQERELFREQVLEYKKSKGYGIPVDFEPISFYWLLIPLLCSVACLWLYFSR